MASVDNGAPFAFAWKKPVAVPVLPGRHQVEVWVPYLWMRQMGKNGIVVDVAPGATVPVYWFAPLITLMKGKITVGS